MCLQQTKSESISNLAAIVWHRLTNLTNVEYCLIENVKTCRSKLLFPDLSLYLTLQTLPLLIL